MLRFKFGPFCALRVTNSAHTYRKSGNKFYPGGFECLDQCLQLHLIGGKSSFPKPYLPLVDLNGIA